MSEMPFDPERLVAIASFEDPLRAQMAKGLLLSAGIECFLQGEHVNQMLSPAFRARLRVLAGDEAEARELLGSVDAPALLGGVGRREPGV